MGNIAQEVGILLNKHKLTLGTVESATGGLIAHLITRVSGSSDYFLGSIISYSNSVKNLVAGVKKETLDNFGAVSPETAEEMASAGKNVLQVDICISDTGIAGPTGATKNKPIGLYYIGMATIDGVFNRKYIFKENRIINNELAATAALNWLKEYLNDYEKPKNISSDIKIKHVVTCFLMSNKRILLLRRSNKVSTYKGLWAGVSGYADRPPDEQAWVEIREETGLTKKEAHLAVKGKPLEITDIALKTRWIVHPYLFNVSRVDAIKIDWEHTEYKWVDPAIVSNFDIVPGLDDALNMVIADREQNGTGD
jgi:nicotinamide-nucleotide amidase